MIQNETGYRILDTGLRRIKKSPARRTRRAFLQLQGDGVWKNQGSCALGNSVIIIPGFFAPVPPVFERTHPDIFHEQLAEMAGIGKTRALRDVGHADPCAHQQGLRFTDAAPDHILHHGVGEMLFE